MGNVIKSHTLTTIREEFDEYVLEDGNTLRIKDVLVAFGFGDKIETSNEGKKSMKAFISVKQVNGVLPTGNVDVSQLKLIDRPVTPKDRLKELKIEPKKISLNLYETQDYLIIVRNRLNEVWTTPFKDKDDIPIYSINSSSAIDAPNKNELAVIKDDNSTA